MFNIYITSLETATPSFDLKSHLSNKMTESKGSSNIPEDVKNQSIDSADITQNKLEIPNLVDFSNIETQKKYHPDTIIQTKDNKELHFHKVLLVGVKYFDEVYNGPMKSENRIKFDFNSKIVSVYLNCKWAHDGIRKTIHGCVHGRQSMFVSDNIIEELLEFANFIQDKNFGDICAAIYNSTGKVVTGGILESLYNLDISAEFIMQQILNGAMTFGEEVPMEFMCDCYDYGMTKNLKSNVVQYVIPYYEPTDKQLKLFTIPTNCTLFGTAAPSERATTVTKGVGGYETINRLLARKDALNNPGIMKFIMRLTKLAFNIPDI
jgi:hypothetical protein